MKETNKNYDKFLNITKNEVHTKYKAIIRLGTDKLQKYDEKITANENMFNNEYRIYYDTGNLVYIKQYGG